MSAAKHVLFVCTGNTCRSPLAEGLFRKAVADRADYTVSSAGTSAYPGDSPAKETLAALRRRGVELDGFASRLVSKEIIAEATHVFAMTRGHLAQLESRFPEFTDKFYLTCEFADIEGEGIGMDVPDPIGQGKRAYEYTAGVLEQAIPSIVAYIDGTVKG
jgi:protein-tyrosine-phosphatase